MNGLIAYRYIGGEYRVVASGVGLVLNIQADKVIPVKEHVARQAERLEYDGEKLKLKPGERLRTLEELNAENEAHDMLLDGTPDDDESEIVEVIE